MARKGEAPHQSNTPEVLIARYVEKTEDCWIWKGRRDRGGYAKAVISGRLIGGHRVMYEYFVGPIPEGMELDHLCRNRACVNPAHLELVTRRENILRGVSTAAQNAKKIVCIRGHQLSGANLYMPPNGGRRCRTCINAKEREAYRRNPMKRQRQR